MLVRFKKPLPQFFVDKLNLVYNVLRNNIDYLQIKEIYLFGSVARGDFDGTSDIDFMLVPNNGIPAAKVSLRVENLDIRDDIGNPNIDIVVRTEDYLNSPADLFAKEFWRDKLLLWRRTT